MHIMCKICDIITAYIYNIWSGDYIANISVEISMICYTRVIVKAMIGNQANAQREIYYMYILITARNICTFKKI